MFGWREFGAWERKLIPSPMIPVFGTNKERKVIAKGRENWGETHSLLPRMESVSVPRNGLVRSIVLRVRPPFILINKTLHSLHQFICNHTQTSQSSSPRHPSLQSIQNPIQSALQLTKASTTNHNNQVRLLSELNSQNHPRPRGPFKNCP